MSNASKARDRILLASDDLRRSAARLQEGDYPDSAFRMQLSVENACKAALSFLGVEYGPTHFPSALLGRVLSSRDAVRAYSLGEDHIGLLVRAVTHASALESQGAMPRYGWETETRIVSPREIYDEGLVRKLLSEGVEALRSVAGFFRAFALSPDLQGAVEELRRGIEYVSKKLG